MILQHHEDGHYRNAFSPPLWVLAMGGFAIVVGVGTMGHRVMKTVGEGITRLSFTKGFAAQFGASVSVLVATVAGLPISTTAVLVGAVAGVGFVSGKGGVDLKVMGHILAGWVITLPAAGSVTALVFLAARAAVE